MTRILTMPAMAAESTTVCYTVTHDDLIDFAREIIERTKEMDEAEKAETSASVEDGYYTRKEVMTLLKRCDSTMTKWAHAGYLVPVRVGGKHLYRKSDVDKLIGKQAMDAMYNNPSDYVMVGREYYRKYRTPYDMSSDKVELVPWLMSQKYSMTTK